MKEFKARFFLKKKPVQAPGVFRRSSAVSLLWKLSSIGSRRGSRAYHYLINESTSHLILSPTPSRETRNEKRVANIPNSMRRFGVVAWQFPFFTATSINLEQNFPARHSSGPKSFFHPPSALFFISSPQ